MQNDGCSAGLTVPPTPLPLQAQPLMPGHHGTATNLTSKQTVTVPQLQTDHCNLGEVEQQLGTEVVLFFS